MTDIAFLDPPNVAIFLILSIEAVTGDPGKLGGEFNGVADLPNSASSLFHLASAKAPVDLV
jgi:hypothetical protein